MAIEELTEHLFLWELVGSTSFLDNLVICFQVFS
jgi:hypothetical protein